jgi:hypothetical protein
MIDFPSSPAVGQPFVAPNGVTYQWDGTVWQTSSAGGTGQVQASSGNFTPSTGADVVIVFASIISGNAGNWLNTVNGRYTPPPGRYFLQCTTGVQAPAGGNGTWTLKPRKNGVQIPNSGAVGSGSAQFSVPLTVGVYVDANGTDYFDWVANCASAGMANQGGQFTAFPLSGMSGPQGPLSPGALSLYQEVVLAASAIDMRLSWPSGVRKIEIEYFCQNAVADTVGFRAMLNGVPNSAANYASQYLFGSGSTPSAGQVVSAAQWQALGGMLYTKGTLKPVVPAAQSFIEAAQVGVSATAGYTLSSLHWGTPGVGMNGLQLFNIAGNQFSAGSFARLYVVP